MVVRTTIQLDEEVFDRVRRLVPPRGLSRFVNEVLEARLSQIERERIEADMREGYIATRADRQALNEDWGAIDGEGWPDDA